MGFTPAEVRLIARLDSPRKIQDFLETFPIDFRSQGDTCRSPLRVLRERHADCMEGAMLAAAIQRFHGHPPLVLDLAAVPGDLDHVIAPFRQHGCWGAISKTNYAVLRYREPVYRTIRELAMSFFHEYIDRRGRKNLRRYSRPVNLTRFDHLGWMTAEEDVWEIPEYLCDVRHAAILTRAQIATLRRADPVERKAGEVVQWRR